MIEYNTLGMIPIPLSIMRHALTGSAKCQLNRGSVALVSRLNLGSANPDHPRPPKIYQATKRFRAGLNRSHAE